MRGKVVAVVFGGKLDGITPACAGKSSPSGGVCTTARDHPRVCGEKRRSKRNGETNPGSPPRVRGKEDFVRRPLDARGITPACAGKRSSHVSRLFGLRDHPRVCGEKTSQLWSLYHSSGSPPRVRGKEAELIELQRQLGITPACAGKSLRRSRCHSACQDHPRVCGEKA